MNAVLFIGVVGLWLGATNQHSDICDALKKKINMVKAKGSADPSGSACRKGQKGRY